MIKIASLLFVSLTFLNSTCFGQRNWEPCNGTPYGPVNTIVTESNGNVYVLETYSSYDYGPYAGGIYKSDSTAIRWQWLTGERFYQGEYFACLALDSSGAIYTSPFPDNPYRSDDGGKTWRNISSNLPQDPETSTAEVNVFACGRNGLLYAGMANGVFRSSNSGSSWLRADSGLGVDTTVNLLAVDTGGTLFAATYSELFRSSDSGKSWTVIDTGRITAITVDFINRILISRGQQLFRSIDHGTSWTDLHVPILESAAISSIATDRSGRLCVGTYSNRGFRSLDDGANWLAFGANLSDTAFLSLAFNRNGDLYVGTNTSVIKSENGGQAWNSLGVGIEGAGLLIPLPNGNIIAEAEGGGILEGSSGMFLTTDEGDSWSEYPIGTISSQCTSTNGSVFVTLGPAMLFGDSVARSTDSGKTWKVVYVEPRGLSSLVSSANGDIFVDDNYNGILRSTDDGVSWSPVLPQSSGGSWSNLFFAKGNLYVSLDSSNGFTTSSLFRSSDDGGTWGDVCNTLPYYGFTPFGSDSKGDLYFGSEEIYRSTDSGVTWQMKVPTQGSATAFGNDSEGVIYCGMAGVGPPSILRSTNDGLSWPEFDDPSFQEVSSFATIPNGRVFVGTNAGVFRSLDSGVAAVTRPDQEDDSGIIRLNNSPNPFNLSTSISFILPEPSYLDLTLFDASGHEIETLAKEYLNSGSHSIPFERGKLPAGVYFYRLSANGTSETQAMVVLP